MINISQKYKNLLNRPIGAIVHFSDVFPEREVDIDAELTAITRNLGNLSDKTFPIGKNLKIAEYGVDLLSDLIVEQKRIIKQIKEKTGIIVENDFAFKAVLCIANCAPRNKETTKNNKNGNDFHLAITDSGLEIFAVPLSNLKYLETRDKILALYRIPSEKLVLTDVNHEQFRSSIIATSRYFPETFETIFEYENVEDLKKAKENKTHPQIIPAQEKLVEFAFADKFGNVRISIRDNYEFMSGFGNAKFGDYLQIQIGNSEFKKIVYKRSLKELEENEFGIYENVADPDSHNACYWEIVKKSKDCNNEKESAVHILKDLNPNFKNEEIVIKSI